MKEEYKNMKEFLASLGLSDSNIRLITYGSVADAKIAKDLVRYYVEKEIAEEAK